MICEFNYWLLTMAVTGGIVLGFVVLVLIVLTFELLSNPNARLRWPWQKKKINI